MFGIDSSELAIIALVALLVIGPKDLPRVMRMVGNWIAKGRAMTRHVRAGFDTMMREAELEEMQKAWAAQNEAIMKATELPNLNPGLSLSDLSTDTWMVPTPPDTPEAPVDAPKARRRAKPAPAAEVPAADAAAAPKRKRAAKAKPTEPAASET
ncbi:MAG: twin-arginine translocase subunit TatB [Sandarakinorhabdus sp.]|nr:twin-arginine translocase subunit TatB [Sandarakinorhabdus sp.]